MEQPFSWILIALASTLVLFLVAGLAVFVRLRADRAPLSPEQRAEWARTPLSPLQKFAWLGLLLGLAEGVGLILYFRHFGGAETYWEDDATRHRVVGIFLGGMVFQSILMALSCRGADERELRLIRAAPQFQAVGLLLGVAAWNVYLGQSFHEQGAVPMVYHYLGFGSLFILYLTTWFAGVLLASRLAPLHAEG